MAGGCGFAVSKPLPPRYIWIDTGALNGQLVADLPKGEGAFPVLALRENARERTWIIIATPRGAVENLAALGGTAAPAFDTDLSQEAALRATTPLLDRPADTSAMLMLGGSMQPYLWMINEQTWGNHTPITAKSGQRVKLIFHNMSMIAHPRHLHGHSFQVVAINLCWGDARHSAGAADGDGHGGGRCRRAGCCTATTCTMFRRV